MLSNSHALELFWGNGDLHMQGIHTGMLSLGCCAILHVGKQVIFIHLSPVSLCFFYFVTDSREHA